MNYVRILSILSLLLCGSHSARILGLQIAGSKSHYYYFNSIVKILAENGHSVTVITPFKSSEETANVRNIVLDYNVSENITKNLQTASEFPQRWIAMAPQACFDALVHAGVQKTLEESFDLILLNTVGTDCFLSVIQEMQIPWVLVSSTDIPGSILELTGGFQHPTAIPHIITKYAYPMTFIQRCLNTLITVILDLSAHWSYLPKFRNECIRSGVCAEDVPKFDIYFGDASLIFVNKVRQLLVPSRPIPQNVIYAGGIHLNPPQPLPKDLEQWIEGSGNKGFIFFSLGSWVPVENMGYETCQAILRVFASLEQRVIWKWNPPAGTEIPANVMVGKWFPQQDLLAHSKIRLFITHGGLLSNLEATYYGVPIIGIPFFVDQFGTMESVENEGYGRKVDWETLEENDFKETIINVLSNSSIHAKADYRARIMRDQGRDVKEDVLYWLEYVIRHKGAKHLKNSFAEMTWTQKYNVDVWIAIIICFMCVISSLIMAILFCMQKLCKKITKRKKD